MRSPSRRPEPDAQPQPLSGDLSLGDLQSAIDGATGAVQWKWQPTYRNAGNRSGVAVGEGKVFALAGESRVVALDCVNMVKDYVQGRKLVVEGASLDPFLLGRSDVSLKEMGANPNSTA